MPAESYFYHSFPRRAKRDVAYGLRVLHGLLKSGLLLTPEVMKIQDGRTEFKILQQRISFTELPQGDLAAHAEEFGAFSLEYDQAVLRELGAVPVFYVPGYLQGVGGLSASGSLLASRAAYLREFFNRLIAIKTALREPGDALFKGLTDGLVSLEEMGFTAEAFQNLFYPTDDAHYNGPLHYYRQREWKVIPNFALGGKWEIQKPTEEERRFLLELSSEYFNRELEGFGMKRIDHCAYFRAIQGRPVLSMARRIIVPDEMVEKAQGIVKELGHAVTVVAANSLGDARKA